MTDLPITERSSDTLKVGSYVDALKEFILQCSTPMSIALQGDWGTGKTSFINLLQKEIELGENKNTENTSTIYFNTWQYSQFNMSDNLYTCFLSTILEALYDKAEIIEEEKSSYLKRVIPEMKKVLPNIILAIVNTLENITGVDVKPVASLSSDNNQVESKFENEKLKKIEYLKDEFQKLVKKAIDKKKDY